MSKIGKKIISIPAGVTASFADGVVRIKGPKGEEVVVLHPKVKAEISEQKLTVAVANPEDRRQKALWGTFRSLLQNAITGVTAGWDKRLEIQGVGYKAAVANGKLTLNLGYSHPVELAVPEGLEVKVEKLSIVISGREKQAVGQFAALVRSQRKPEPYKGKGIS